MHSVEETAAKLARIHGQARADVLNGVLSAARAGDDYNSHALDFNARLVTRLRQIEAWPPTR